ncbi:MAG TPA: TetR/AcrR family transcriptional regulator [Casimicrobiaceae bacterium]|nr:TetR/AcrR family transcriptional regulator [Casimicrobiaceae bacterium]
MAIRQRAMGAEDKEERQQGLLDAAERLLLRSPDRMASVAEVADEAGLAKGTVYLYFPSKEELLLALHERNVGGFFRALIAMLDGDDEVNVEKVLALTHEHMVDPPLFLPLAARCFGLMAQSIPDTAAIAFKQRMATRLERAGAGLEKHFPLLAPGEGVVLLRHSYALILGLWQMAGAHGVCPATATGAIPAAFTFNYPDDLDRALRALWRGVVGGPAAPVHGSRS